ncbi:MAG: response regulator [Variovorax sp.]
MPVPKQPQAEISAARGDSASSQSSLRILLVEDDPAERADMLELLRQLGHWATAVDSAEVARDRYLDGVFDVVITDVRLPALSGIDLVELLRSQHRVHAIFVSGYERPAQLPADAVWLDKPFTQSQLTDTLASIEKLGLRT